MKKSVKLLSCLVALLLLLTTSTSFSFAMSEQSEGESYEINSVKLLKEKMSEVGDGTELSDFQRMEIIEKTNPKVLGVFVEEKMNLFVAKLNTLEMEGTGETKIDLGDGCSAVVKTFDISEELETGIRPLANTPGADTYWKDYGNRRFTTRFEFTTGAINWNYILVHQYTLSSSGVDYRDSYADIESGMVINIGTASHGSIVKHKKVAHKIGESIHISCKFNCRWAPKHDVSLLDKTLDIHSYVKYSDIDKVGKQVKVVQSWNGKWV